MKPLETDQNGEVILRPLTGWRTAPVADLAALLVIEYLETPEQLETRDSKAIQFVMTPAQALDLADALKELGDRLLQTQPGTSLQ